MDFLPFILNLYFLKLKIFASKFPYFKMSTAKCRCAVFFLCYFISFCLLRFIFLFSSVLCHLQSAVPSIVFTFLSFFWLPQFSHLHSISFAILNFSLSISLYFALGSCPSGHLTPFLYLLTVRAQFASFCY